MPVLLFLLFLPFAEFVFFGVVSSRIGPWNALGLLGLNTVIGVMLLQHQGMKSLQSLDSIRRHSTNPETPFDQICAVLAGILFFIPGFLTDILGALLLLPFIRSFLKYLLKTRGNWTFYEYSSRAESSDIIEGEYERLDETRITRESDAKEKDL